MTGNEVKGSILPRYRILDLTEGGCMLGGRLLGDLGADVIKIESPVGSPSRLGPYYRDIPEPEKSIPWFAFNFNKRGITLNINTPEGQDLFKALVETADAILESFMPGYLTGLNLGYADLGEVKPDIILTSITPFGQSGPKARYVGSDLTTWASGGYLYACGEPDRAPLWVGYPQASLFGGTEAAIGTMTALYHRAGSGEGQHVDVSIQESSISSNFNVLQMWDVNKVEFRRPGGCLYVPSTGVRQPIYFRCQDGHIMILVQGGNEPFVSSSQRLVTWMNEEDMAPDWLKALDWKIDYNASTMAQDIADRVGAAVEKFTLTKTKSELYQEGAINRQILIAPVGSARDISDDRQLKSRDYWVKLNHSELAQDIPYCGPFIKMSQTPIKYTRPAPLIGEHNDEIYLNELGLSQERLLYLKEKKIV